MRTNLVIYILMVSCSLFSQCFIGLSMKDLQKIYKEKLVFYRYDYNSKYVEIDLSTKLNVFEFGKTNDTIISYTSIFFNNEDIANEVNYNNNKFINTGDSTWIIDLVDGNQIQISMSYSTSLKKYFFIYEKIGEIKNKTYSMHDIEIGDPISKLDNISLEKIAVAKYSIKYKTQNGNYFSITHHNGTIVFMENDWSDNEKGKIPLSGSFVFGKTSLKDIRDNFQSNGFIHNNVNLATDEDVITYNCYGLNSLKDEVIVFITKANKVEISKNKEKVDELLKLNSIIIAKSDYLDLIWGSKKTYDPKYKKINK